jgi:hypothetical protein
LENISGKKSCIRKRESGKRKNKEDSADASLKKRQLTARYQCIELLGEEFMKNGNYFLLISTFFLSGTSKDICNGRSSGAAKSSSVSKNNVNAK